MTNLLTKIVALGALVLLLGASRLRWIAAHPWALIIAGPFAFVGCYVGLCACAVKVGAI